MVTFLDYVNIIIQKGNNMIELKSPITKYNIFEDLFLVPMKELNAEPIVYIFTYMLAHPTSLYSIIHPSFQLDESSGILQGFSSA